MPFFSIRNGTLATNPPPISKNIELTAFCYYRKDPSLIVLPRRIVPKSLRTPKQPATDARSPDCSDHVALAACILLLIVFLSIIY